MQKSVVMSIFVFLCLLCFSVLSVGCAGFSVMQVDRTVYRVNKSDSNETAVMTAVQSIVRDFDFADARGHAVHFDGLAGPYALADRGPGQPIRLTAAVEAASWAFKREDIADLDALAAKLKSASGELSRFIGSELSPETARLLSAYRGGPELKLQAALAGDLTTIVCRAFTTPLGVTIYTEQRFSGIALSAETIALLNRARDRNEQAHLNRLLLQDAYPRELVKTHEVDRIRVDLAQRSAHGTPTAMYIRIQSRLDDALRRGVGNTLMVERQRYRLP
jgi:hypothetical protein